MKHGRIIRRSKKLRTELAIRRLSNMLLLCFFLPFAGPVLAQHNEVLGKVELIGDTKGREETSGVWAVPLSPSTGYTVSIAGVADVAGQVMSTPQTTTFTNRAERRPDRADGNVGEPGEWGDRGADERGGAVAV